MFGILKISINSHEKTCAGVIFNAVAGLRLASALKNVSSTGFFQEFL